MKIVYRILVGKFDGDLGGIGSTQYTDIFVGGGVLMNVLVLWSGTGCIRTGYSVGL